jgi:ribosomal protein RSM22 (predicted rRNA methylase)
MWAACAVWPDLQDISLLEREENMIALGKKLAKYSNRTSIQNAEWHRADMIDIEYSSLFRTGKSPFSVVTASYVLGEMKEEHRENFIKNLWQLTDGILLFIEPGTPAGFQHIQQARDLLPALGAYITAPCPCSEPCPMTDSNWCHFSQRVPRSRLHRQVKEADLSYEDEKFSFIALSHIPGKNIHGRVIRHPQFRKGHVIIESCSMGGLKTRTVTRKDKEMYRIAKELGWGSEWPFE